MILRISASTAATACFWCVYLACHAAATLVQAGVAPELTKLLSVDVEGARDTALKMLQHLPVEAHKTEAAAVMRLLDGEESAAVRATLRAMWTAQGAAVYGLYAPLMARQLDYQAEADVREAVWALVKGLAPAKVLVNAGHEPDEDELH